MIISRNRAGMWVCAMGTLLGPAAATVPAQGVDPGFTVEMWANKGFVAANQLVTNVTFVRDNPPTGAVRDIQVINFNDSGCPGDFPMETPYPILPTPPNNEFILRATALLFFPDTSLVTFGVRSDDGFQLNIEGVEIASFSGGRNCNNPTDFDYTPPRAGFLEVELIQWEGTGGAGVEFQQILDNGDVVLVNDPDDDRGLRAFQIPDTDTAGRVIFDPAGPINVTRFDANASINLFVPSDGQGKATQDNVVDVTSTDPASAAVVGSPLTFNAGGSQKQSFAIDFGTEGTATIQLSGSAAIPTTELTVNVIAVRSLALRLPSPLQVGNSRRVDVVGDFGDAGRRNLTDPATGTT